ncbi:MAG: endonuclease/exonuclease/phosphatase family protein [Mycobacteriaceae bacterium]
MFLVRKVAQVFLPTLILLSVAVVIWARFLGVDSWPIIAQATSFRLPITIALAILACGLLWRRRLFAALLAVLAVFSAVGLFPRAVSEVPAADGATIFTVMTLNVYKDAADVQSVADAISSSHADVVALPEASAVFADAVLARLGPGYVRGSDDNHRSSGSGATLSMIAKTVLRPQFHSNYPDLLLGSQHVTVLLDGRSVDLYGVHPSPPVPGNLDNWGADLVKIRELCVTSTPTVIMGDFNATVDHQYFQQLIDSGCSDVRKATGSALAATWPSILPQFLGSSIDQVLTAGPGVLPRQSSVRDISGSDHRAVFATLAVR